MDDINLKPFMEQGVSDYVDEIIGEDKSICGCSRCRLDVITAALNDVKPKYVVTDKGLLNAPVGELMAQFRADAIDAVRKALRNLKECLNE